MEVQTSMPAPETYRGWDMGKSREGMYQTEVHLVDVSQESWVEGDPAFYKMW